MFGVFFSFIFITCTLTNKLTKCPSDFLISCADLVAPTPTKGKFKLYSKDTKKTFDTPPPRHTTNQSNFLPAPSLPLENISGSVPVYEYRFFRNQNQKVKKGS